MSKQPAVFFVNAALFDCDGTLVNSTGAISEFYRHFAKTRPHVDAEEICRTSHGVRTFDVVQKWSPEDADPEQVNKWEGEIPDSFGQYAVPVKGSVELAERFDELSRTSTENGVQRWAIVTSGGVTLASKWLKLLKLKKPDVFITAENVTIGKPHPMGYLMAREALGYKAASAKVVVFEDAPAGFQAGKGAGAIIVGICSTYDAEKVRKSGADIVVDDLSSFDVTYDKSTDLFKVVVNDYHYANEEFL